MGIYDRGYFDGDEWRPSARARGSQSHYSVVKALIVVNIAVFVLDMFSGSSGGEARNLGLSTFLSLKRGLADAGGYGPLDSVLYLWELLTYGFTHASITSSSGIFHILFNMFVLFSLGRPVEARYGSAEFLRFYLLAIVISGTVWLLTSAISGHPGSVVGASGAVVGVVILFVLNYPRETLLIMGVIPAPAWVIGVLCVGTDIMLSFSRETTIAAETHLAGAAFAALYFYGNWNFGGLQFQGLAKRLRPGPRLKVHVPDDKEARLASEADRILEKLHQQGESSLTAKERKVLEQYSRKVRQSRD
jgi:membrane associated rhomboid family serine protease